MEVLAPFDSSRDVLGMGALTFGRTFCCVLRFFCYAGEPVSLDAYFVPSCEGPRLTFPCGGGVVIALPPIDGLVPGHS